MSIFFHEAGKFVALEQYISMAMHLQLKCHIFNVLLWGFFLLICVVFFLIFIYLIKHTEYMGKIAEITIVTTVWKVYIREFFIVSCRKFETD